MSSACYPAQMAGEHGSAVFFQSGGLDEVLAAVGRAVSGIDALRKRAEEKAVIWNMDNGIARLAEQFLSLGRAGYSSRR
jgi:hypothetical protein